MSKPTTRTTAQALSKPASHGTGKQSAASATGKLSKQTTLPQAPQRLRIIGGQWKRTVIQVSHAPGLRPTPDRVRETLFNWLGQDLSGWRCLDLFAGSGALGFEAASRGADQVVLVENNPLACKQMTALIHKLQANHLQLHQIDALLFLQKNQRLMQQQPDQTFDLIFLDPPFHTNALPPLFPLLHDFLKPEGLFYMESEFPLTPDLPWLTGYNLIRQDKAGASHYALLRR